MDKVYVLLEDVHYENTTIIQAFRYYPTLEDLMYFIPSSKIRLWTNQSHEEVLELLRQNGLVYIGDGVDLIIKECSVV